MEFWVDSDTIHCLIHKNFDCMVLEGSTLEIFKENIKALSNGEYLPLLINLTEVGRLKAFQLFGILSPCSPFGIKVPPRIFLVKSFFVKMVLGFFCVVNGNAFWNTIYVNAEKEIFHEGQRFGKINLINER